MASRQAAAWRHLGLRDGFEVVFLEPARGGHLLEGHVAAVEEGCAWGLRYQLRVDDRWATRTAVVVSIAAAGSIAVRIEGDGQGRWRVDDRPAPELDGCLDVDLEASACTNCLPVRRLALEPGEEAKVAAVYVRAADLGIERLEQTYRRLEGHRYEYASSRFGYRNELLFDEDGLVVDYPDLAARTL
jgi:uncharacterized protein